MNVYNIKTTLKRTKSKNHSQDLIKMLVCSQEKGLKAHREAEKLLIDASGLFEGYEMFKLIWNIKHRLPHTVSQMYKNWEMSPGSKKLWACLWRQTSGALWLAGLGEFALQEHSGNTKPLLLVDRLSQDVVVGNGMEARLLKQLSQELWKQTQRPDWDLSGSQTSMSCSKVKTGYWLN